MGTSLPFFVNRIHIWFTGQLEWRWFLSASGWLLVFLNAVMLCVMAYCAILGFAVSKSIAAIRTRKSRKVVSI
jgi:hypothetical protein